MKNLYILTIFLLSFFFSFSQQLRITSDPTVCTKQIDSINGLPVNCYYFKKTNNAVNISSNFSLIFTSMPFASTDVVTVEIRSITEHGGDVVYSQRSDVGRGFILNVNTDNLGSGIYRVFLINGSIEYPMNDNLIITEKYITDEFNGCKFEYVYVQNFFKVRPNRTVGTNIEMINAETAFISNFKRALRFAWNYEITKWNTGGLTKPYFTDPTYRIYISGTGDLLRQNALLYHGVDGVFSDATDNTRAIWFPVNAKRDMVATTTLDDSTFFKEVVGHEFFHGLQFSIMKNSKIHAAHPTDTGYNAELNRRMWMIEGQARFLETVLMNSSIRNGKNAAYEIGSMYDDYSVDAKAYIRNTLGGGSDYNKDDILDLYKAGVGYKFCLWWRHVYEHGFATDKTDAQRLGFLSETLKSYDSIPTSNYGEIRKFLGKKLRKLNSTFSPTDINKSAFDSAMTSFAEQVYFQNSRWRGKLANLGWTDPNTNKFYDSTYKESTALRSMSICDKVSESATIISPFQIRSHLISNTMCSSPLRITVSNAAKLNCSCYQIRKNKIIAKTNFIDTVKLCYTAGDSVVVLTYRKDASVGVVTYDVKIEYQTLNADSTTISATQIAGKPDYTVQLKSSASLTSLPYFKWTIGSDSSKKYSPQMRIQKPGSYTVSLTRNFCGKQVVKKNIGMINIAPIYIKSCTIKTDVSTFNFNRAINASGQLVLNYPANNTVAKDKPIEITVETSKKLIQLTAEITLNSTIVYSQTQNPTASGQCKFSFVPYTVGAYTLTFKGIDSNNAVLLNRSVFSKPLFSILPNGLPQTDTSYTNCMGPDNFYNFKVIPQVIANIDSDAPVSIMCSETYVTFFNNSTVDLTIDYGDGQSGIIPANSQTTHLYNKNTNAKVYTLSGALLRIIKIILK